MDAATKKKIGDKVRAAWARKKVDTLIDSQTGITSLMRGVQDDPVDHPKHYTTHPSGVECIQITEHLNFCVGNAVKYAWRAGEKGNYVQDLEKAVWYLQREIARVSK